MFFCLVILPMVLKALCHQVLTILAQTITSNQPLAQNRILQEIEFQENLEPYIISDIGISVNL